MKKFLLLLSFLSIATEAKTIDVTRTIKDINWSELNMPFVKKVATVGKYYRVTFFDDFKGKPDNTAESTYCYDTLKPQCTIWSGYNSGTFPCDLSHLSLSDPGPAPPMQANFKSAMYSLNPYGNYEGKSLSEVKSLYSTVVHDRWIHMNKCNWTSYLQVNWMATDYGNPAKFSAKMDPTQITVDPRGNGYLIVSARKGKVVEDCAFGGTKGPVVNSIMGEACLIKNVQSAISGPLNVYWIDSNQSWPGIFYHKINGGCPYGGSGPVNCQVYSFAPGEISPMISYGLTSVGGQATAFYYNKQKFACNHNTEYPNGGVAFNKVSCPMFNGGILSQNFVDATNHQNGFSQKNGIFEVKERIPVGKGAFPASWLMPTKGGWPYSGGEIDVMEARDAADEVYQTFHQGKCIDSVTKNEIIQDPNHPTQFIDNGNCQRISNAVSINYSKGTTSGQRKANEFFVRDHVYSVEWNDSKIQWYLNNVPTNTIAPGVTPSGYNVNNPLSGLASAGDIPSNLRNYEAHNMPHDPFYWILNHSTWVSNTDLTNWYEQNHYIDYVKVYTQCSTQNDFCPQGGTFVEGAGCVVGDPAARSVTRNVYASPCVDKFPARTCPAGGDVAGPNCSVYGFERPAVVPGVNYWVDHNPAYPGVYYAKVDGGCPYGGAAGVNCQFEGLAPKLTKPQDQTVLPGVSYWVDTNPAYPGIYYKKINGGCPVGGSGSVNCQLKGFAANFVKPGVYYWVDTNPAWPGIYYRKVNYTCPYGGTSAGPNCQLQALSVPSFYIHPLVNYWLDTDIRWPGIYYQPINGACPHGGSLGVNCQLKAYPKPTKPYVMPNVNYWVDSDVRWPGIYYQKINGACPFGGSAGVNCQLVSFADGVVEPGVTYWLDKNPKWPGVYYAPDFR